MEHLAKSRIDKAFKKLLSEIATAAVAGYHSDKGEELSETTELLLNNVRVLEDMQTTLNYAHKNECRESEGLRKLP